MADKFHQIACVDHPGLQSWSHKNVQAYSENQIVWTNDYPQSNEEIIQNIGSADAALVSWNTKVDAEVIQACPHLKYIGMCCSLIDETSANVDIAAARKQGIIVKGVRDYGDEGVIEYIISELVSLLKGMGKHQWRPGMNLELGGRRLAIIGLGATGKMLMNVARAFGMDVRYFSRTRSAEAEKMGVRYMPLNDLLSWCEIASLHLPKNLKLLDKTSFQAMGAGKILINTSLGTSFDVDAFQDWIQEDDNYLIIDRAGIGAQEMRLKNIDRVIYKSIVSGFTEEAKDRLSQKVVDNIESYFQSRNTKS